MNTRFVSVSTTVLSAAVCSTIRSYIYPRVATCICSQPSFLDLAAFICFSISIVFLEPTSFFVEQRQNYGVHLAQIRTFHFFTNTGCPIMSLRFFIFSHFHRTLKSFWPLRSIIGEVGNTTTSSKGKIWTIRL